MEVQRRDDQHIVIDIDIKTAEKLYGAINGRTVDMTNAAIDFASLMQEACYAARDDFHQPPHAFDAQAPHHPIAED
ncbi:hypothetical protein [Acidihalobacter ferrooxydans]|uniref:Uncharacterized protein n=1 Tax=Acidihalobacter ferrooxydans TaxID=1765967 RepID=A0A1P8UD25_9GAMM|nr:hypothetical protein [Acidihalobacter ferrooxydans]APZ41762.1 hypothetical protein BW247_00515 [Acidihalobacter ferrooxydans]